MTKGGSAHFKCYQAVIEFKKWFSGDVIHTPDIVVQYANQFGCILRL